MDNAKILLLDIETSPLVVYTWEVYEANAIKKIKNSEILSVAYQWLGQPTQVIAQDKHTEKQILKKLHALLSRADIVIAHNGDAFDVKKINSRFIMYDMPPPSPYRTIDTKKVAKNVFAFDSNSLNNIGIDLGEGEKIKHRGFDMWEGCMCGKKHDWEDMKKYNKRDVDLLVSVYMRMRPWITNHPRVSEHGHCPSCGSANVRRKGIRRLAVRSVQKLKCLDCNHWFYGGMV